MYHKANSFSKRQHMAGLGSIMHDTIGPTVTAPSSPRNIHKAWVGPCKAESKDSKHKREREREQKNKAPHCLTTETNIQEDGPTL